MADEINVTVGERGSLSVTVGGGSAGQLPDYRGEYLIAPAVGEDITLPTAAKSVRRDITVLAVPVTETANESGGLTLTIGRQEDV